MKKRKIKIILADDHQMFLDGITSLLKKNTNYDILATASSGEMLLNLLEKHQPDIVITDLEMGGLSGVDASEIIRKQYPGIKIIALTMHNEEGFVRKLIESGVSGFILKNAGRQELTSAIDKVYSGDSYFSPEVINTVIDSLNNPKSKKEEKLPLSNREKQIISLICKEHTTKDIAEILNLSPLTVESHRKNIFLKLGVKNIAGLVRLAVKHGLDE